MKQLLILAALLILSNSYGQKTFIDAPYIESTAKADTLVTPDKLYLDILLTEKDIKSRKTVDEMEHQMEDKLKSLGINTQEQLFVNDLSSSLKRYLLKQNDIKKSKNFTLIVYDAKTAGLALAALEDIGVANVWLQKTEYSRHEDLNLQLKIKATLKAKKHAVAMAAALNQKVGSAIMISDAASTSSANYMAGAESTVILRGVSSITGDIGPTNLEIQKVKIQVVVNAKFKLE
ncbi:MAG: SIMPL domain-containing protein [Flavobacterium sp.]|nr:SIMPL domain-containing protein [Flavobacterium sp.]